MKTTSLLICLLLSSLLTLAGDFASDRLNYINKYKDDAIRDMIKTDVPASITLAQACLESSNGTSKLALDANNHFGIKCSNWNGPTFIQDDDEKDECFRKYTSVLESYDDHSNFLRSRPRYAFLFDLPKTDYKGWAKGLKKAGYATDPSYADRLIKIIEEYQLDQLDKGGDIHQDLYAVKPPDIAKEEDQPKAYASVDKPRTEHRVFVPSVEIVDALSSRKIQSINGVDYIIAKEGDTWRSLAKEFNYGYWQLPKYNETSDRTPIVPGQIVYIKPKKSDNADRTYVVEPGDNIYLISQKTGLKLKQLLKFNNIQETDRLEAGRTLHLAKPTKS